MEMLHQALYRASGEILGAHGQSRLSFVVVTDLAGVLRRSTGVGRRIRIRPDSHNNSLKNLIFYLSGLCGFQDSLQKARKAPKEPHLLRNRRDYSLVD